MAEAFIDPVVGFELNVQETTVTAEFQEEKLQSQRLDPDVFGLNVDPSFYIGLGIKVGIESGISAEGNVNMLSRIVMHRPIALDELLFSHGVITAVEAVPRGHRVSTDVWFEDAAGDRVISVPRISLKPDASAMSKRGAGERPAPVVEDTQALQILANHQLSPEGTKAYSREGNAIHYEVEAAAKAGFRAPIIGGGQGVHFLMAALWQQFMRVTSSDVTGPQSLDLEIFFRRPVFWDQSVGVGMMSDRSAIALVTGKNEHKRKVLTEARIKRLQ
ncbi:MAG: hypothetical protein ACI8Z1_001310 [Candidatus Azotimanducaceae bacterium]|jgi:hypothetical protein